MFKELLSVFLETKCPLCDRTSAETICIYCERKLESCRLAKHCWWQGDLPLFAWGRYDGQLKRAIATMKYDSHPEIGMVLGNCLGKTWRETALKPEKMAVIPIPLHPDKQRSRGFNQAEIIAKGFCQQTGDLLQTKVLLRQHNTEAMFGLNPLERKQNITNAFCLGKQTPKYPLLLLDDIYTSGATAIEATKILTSFGFRVGGVAVVARAVRTYGKT
ncbi:ComF family protein [Myxosarcina sp. GI1]|uniref:ComF family protein n=1 Tax=Myxosarcina sp. GI1 TaxID=1541065 RepID=UPI00055DB79F|nr:ComF family protein [Myxosarcina sp. GI1]